MPTYEYKCDNCGHHFEHYQSMKDDKLTKCPECRKNTLKRLIGTGGGLIFKGSGFYLTDYKNKPSEKTTSPAIKNEPVKTDSSSPDKSAVSKTDSKSKDRSSEKSSKSANSKSSDTSTDKK